MVDMLKAERDAGVLGDERIAAAVPSRDLIRVPFITPSSVGDIECPHKFWQLRVLNQYPPRREPNEAAAFGSAAHDVLRQVYAARQDGIIDLTHVHAMARSAVYRQHYPDGVDRKCAAEKVVEAVCIVVNNDDPEDIAATVSVERQIRFPYRHNGKDAYVVSVRLDRILRRLSTPNTIVSRDYKFGARRIDLREAFLVLWALKQAHPGFNEFALELDWISLADGQIHRDVITGADVKGQHALIRDQILQIAASDEHLPVPGACCSFCCLREECQGFGSVELADGADVF